MLEIEKKKVWIIEHKSHNILYYNLRLCTTYSQLHILMII